MLTRSAMPRGLRAASTATGTARSSGEHERHDDELKRDRDARRDHVGDGLPARERAAEVAGHRMAEPVEVAHQERPIEAEALLERRDRLRGRAVAENRQSRPAGQHVEQRERDEGDAEQHRDHLQEPAPGHPQNGQPGDPREEVPAGARVRRLRSPGRGCPSGLRSGCAALPVGAVPICRGIILAPLDVVPSVKPCRDHWRFLAVAGLALRFFATYSLRSLDFAPAWIERQVRYRTMLCSDTRLPDSGKRRCSLEPPMQGIGASACVPGSSRHVSPCRSVFASLNYANAYRDPLSVRCQR